MVSPTRVGVKKGEKGKQDFHTVRVDHGEIKRGGGRRWKEEHKREDI